MVYNQMVEELQMNSPVVLFRDGFADDDELSMCKKYFETVSLRSHCHKNLVIGRYSVLPYYNELEADLNTHWCFLINTFKQHNYIASFDYYEDVKEFTPKTYEFDNFVNAPECRYIVKGKTNSKKFDWNRRMFAENKRQAVDIAIDLYQDSMLANQGIIYREYIPLKAFERGISGLPFSNEWRFFFLGSKPICWNYYWSIAENIPKYLDPKAIDLAFKIGEIISKKVNFFVLDIAQKEDGDWILIEVNDAQMSGLSCNDPEILYYGLKERLKDFIPCERYI